MTARTARDAVALRAVPFATVVSRAVTRATSLALIGICAVVQSAVHLYRVLHVDFSPSRRGNRWLPVFTAVLNGIMAGGTLRIMADPHHRMLP